LLRPGRLRDWNWRGEPCCLEQLRQASHLTGGGRSRHRAQDDTPHVLQREEPERVPVKALTDGRVITPGGGITLQAGDGKLIEEIVRTDNRSFLRQLGAEVA
jgi:hypothetical protein